MQVTGPASNGVTENRAAFAFGINPATIIKKIGSVKEARALPCGSIVGDLHGGLTFSDAVAAALEMRSLGGWQELSTGSNETWTVIILDR
jgi:hypothetical protein